MLKLSKRRSIKEAERAVKNGEISKGKNLSCKSACKSSDNVQKLISNLAKKAVNKIEKPRKQLARIIALALARKTQGMPTKNSLQLKAGIKQVVYEAKDAAAKGRDPEKQKAYQRALSMVIKVAKKIDQMRSSDSKARKATSTITDKKQLKEFKKMKPTS